MMVHAGGRHIAALGGGGQVCPLSVVTVVLNDADGLRRTIRSLLPQMNEDCEFIVVDGGSTDGTRDVIEEFKGVISRYVSEPDNGIYSAMNRGVALSAGRYLWFLNAGDEATQNAIPEALDSLRSETSETVVCTDVHIRELSGARPQEHIADHENLNFRVSVPHQGAFIPRSAIIKVGGFSENFRLAGDFHLFLLLKRAGYPFVNRRTFSAVFYRGGASDRRYVACRLECIKALWLVRSKRRGLGTVRFLAQISLHLLRKYGNLTQMRWRR